MACCPDPGDVAPTHTSAPTPGTMTGAVGALNIRTRRSVYQVHPHVPKEELIVFLEHLLTVPAKVRSS